MKKFLFDAFMASIAVGGLSYDIFQMIEKLMELQYGNATYFAVLALIQAIFSGYFWGCTDADLKRMFPTK